MTSFSRNDDYLRQIAIYASDTVLYIHVCIHNHYFVTYLYVPLPISIPIHTYLYLNLIDLTSECRPTQPQSTQVFHASGERQRSRVDGRRERVLQEAPAEEFQQSDLYADLY